MTEAKDEPVLTLAIAPRPADRPKLVRKIQRWAERNPEFMRDGSVGDLSVRHDPWCVLLKDGSDCSCAPEITWTPPPPPAAEPQEEET